MVPILQSIIALAGERDVDNSCDPQGQYPISQWCFAVYTYGAISRK